MLRLIVIVTILGFTSSAHPVTRETGSDIAERIAGAIEDNYVEPDTGRKIAQLLREGAWSAVDEFELASRFTELLEPFDGHFSVRFRPAGADTAAIDAPAIDYSAASRRGNYGFKQVEILRGNLGYIDLREFASADLAADTAAGAMQMVANSHALIIDLRRNGGGDPAMVQLLCSYLIEPGVHLNSLYWRPTNQTNQFWTLPVVPGTRMADKPVYVLIGARTGSAAEEFAYNLKALERGTLLGQTTYGAANPGDNFDLGDGWSVFVSTGKAINPITGSNWEGAGVTPDILISEADALAEAQTLALEAALNQADDPLQKQELEWAAAALQASLAPPPTRVLKPLSGHYGDRTLSFDGRQLWYQRGDRLAEPLISVDATLHYLESSATMRLRVETTDQTMRLTEEFYDGFSRSFTRTASSGNAGN